MTYAELHSASDALANHISALCDRKPSIVPVLISQSPLLYVSLLAILKAGSAFCPLNLDAPPDRVKFIYSDTSARLVLSTKELSQSLPPCQSVQLLLVDDFLNNAAPEAPQSQLPDIKAEDLAYVMYTSGSTGIPKGVAITHDAVTQAFYAHDDYIPQFSRFLQFASPTFDVSVFEVFFPFFRGAVLVSALRQDLLDDLPGVIQAADVDACELTPTVAAGLLRSRSRVPKLQLLLTIGEMLNQQVIDEFGGSETKPSLLCALYGPTEATIHCTIQPAFSSIQSRKTIGTPLATVSAFIVKPDAPFEVLPRGMEGELAVGGHQLAQGYINRPEQTSAAFIDSPYGRIYRTGDRAAMLEDGTLQCLGRLSAGQVKLRGQRLELGEVEHGIMKTPGCYGVSASVIGSILVAFCAVDAEATVQAVQDACARWLPRFMIPDDIRLFKTLPRLPSGKIDAKSLVDAYQTRKGTTQTEERNNRILSALKGMLGPDVHSSMSIAEAGIESLTAIKLASLLRADGWNVRAGQILGFSTIGDFCRLLDARSSQVTAPISATVNSDLADSIGSENDLPAMTKIMPCTDLQTAMLAQTAKASTMYWNTVEYEVIQNVSAQEMSQILISILEANPLLRSSFVSHAGRFYIATPQHQNALSIISINDGTCYDGIDLHDIASPLRINLTSANGKVKRLSFVIHHALYDGWSLDLIMTDISALIHHIPLRTRPQFDSVLSHFHTQDNSSGLDDARRFWAEHLLSWQRLPMPKLAPSICHTRRISTSKGHVQLSPNALQSLAIVQDNSAQAYFQAALAYIWGKIIGASDVVIGTVVSGRDIAVDHADEIIGPMISSLPFRLSTDQIPESIVAAAQANNRNLLNQAPLSLSEINKITNIAPGDTLFDVLIVYQQSNSPLDSRIFREAGHIDRTETKLIVEVTPSAEAYEIQATYHDDWFTASFVDQMLSQLDDTMRRWVSGCSNSQYEMQVLSLSEFNPTPTSIMSPNSLAEIVEDSARQYPARLAIQVFHSISEETIPSSSESLTYDELNDAGNRIAAWLVKEGVSSGHVIPIIMEKSMPLYTHILGILKAGCAYLPLLPNLPIERIQEVVDQASATVCVCDSSSIKSCTMLKGVKILHVDMHDSNSQYSSEDRVVAADPARLAYVVYTSGTTGKPKGVAVSNRSIVSNVVQLSKIYPRSISSHGRLLQACSQAFDVSVFEIFYAWHNGMCLCAAVNDVLFMDLEGAIRSMDITHLSFTPTVAKLVNGNNVPNVEFLVTAGEPLAQSVLDNWKGRLWQGYGPSETTNICTVKRMLGDENLDHLGWVFDNTSAFVLDPGGIETLPIGWVGEFCYGGDQIATEYLNNAELTVKKFVQHPKYGRLYRSGDMGRMLADGSLVILGRLDNQIKLRGQRIEPSEINSAITSTGLVATAESILVKDTSTAREILVSFIVPTLNGQKFQVVDTDPTASQEVFSTLRAKLPVYMIPTFLIPLTCLPLTPTGKIDKNMLADSFSLLKPGELQQYSESVTFTDHGEWSATETDLKSTLCAVFALDPSDVQRWSLFSTLGLDSISAIKFVSQLKTRLAISVSISTVLQHPTIAQLAETILTRQTKPVANQSAQFFDHNTLEEIRGRLPAATRENIGSILPCLPLQEAMLAHGKEKYYNHVLLRIHIDATVMQEYCERLVHRHDIFRTVFVTTSSRSHPIAQVTVREVKVDWKHFAVNALSLDGAMSEHMSCLPEPLDSYSLPYSLGLITRSESTFLSLICHHSLYDGVAMNNFYREVEGMAKGSPLPNPTTCEPFLRYTAELPSDVEHFWSQHLRDFNPLFLAAKTDKHSTTQSSHSVPVELTLQAISQHCQTAAVSLLALCQTAWTYVLCTVSAQDDVCFGNVFSGRTVDVEGLDTLIAPCFNTLPVRMRTSSRMSHLDMARSFQALNAKVLSYQFTPLRKVHRICQKRSFFDTLLLVQQPLVEMDASVWTLEADAGTIDVPIACEVVPCPNLDSLAVTLRYDMNTVPDRTASCMADLFAHFLRQVVQAPAASFQRDQLLASYTEILGSIKIRCEKEAPLDRDGIEDSHNVDSLEYDDVVSTIEALTDTPRSEILPSTTIFQLGLDSISAVQLASQLRSLGYAIASADVLDNQTVSRIVSFLRNTSSAEVLSGAEYDLDAFSGSVIAQLRQKAGDATDGDTVFPAIPIQCAMISQSLSSEEYHYLNMVELRFESGVQFKQIDAAWRKVVSVTPMLRTGFCEVRHDDTSYAMIQVAHEPRIFEIQANTEQHINSSKGEIMSDLSIPPWKVLLQTIAGRVHMFVIIHHALYDASSLRTIFRRFKHALTNNELQQSDDLRPGLSQVMTWSAADKQRSIDYWASKADSVSVNSFPLMTPLREEPQSQQTFEMVTSKSMNQIQQLVRVAGISMQAYIQAAWTRVLSSYLGEESVVFGQVLSNRTTETTMNTPIPCLATIPVIVQNSLSNKELLKRLMEYNAGVQRHRHLPLQQIQKCLGYAATSLFDTVIAYQKHPGIALEYPWETLSDQAAVEFPISLEVEMQPSDKSPLLIRLTFAPHVIPTAQAEMVVKQFEASLMSLLTHPEGHADDLIYTAPELFSVTEPAIADMDASVTYMHQFVEQAAARIPSKLAFEFVLDLEEGVPRTQQWTYRQLNEEGNRVAHIVAQFTEPGDIVAINFDKCPEAYFSILGILKAGCGFVALDINAPQSRKDFILADSKAPCLLTSNPEDFQHVPNIRTIQVNQEVLQMYPPTNIQQTVGLTPKSTCYCLYTSGTTGTPKGCLISHENGVQAMMAFQDLFSGHWTTESRCLQFASLHFDVSVLEQYWTWAVGITMVAAPKDLILSDLTLSINALNITHIDLTPSLARLVHPDTVPSLCKGVFITGGEQLKQEILDDWGPAGVIYNAYGPTEATIGVTMYQRVPKNGRPSNIGRQFPNVGSAIVRKGTENPVFRGGVGELCVFGKLVGTGYLNRPELTEERFPTFKELGHRMYRTGDMTRILHDGCFDFLGRSDDQVKLRGQRLEIGEINHCIRSQCLEVKEAATIVTKHSLSGKDVLVTFLSKDDDAKQDVEILVDGESLLARARAACRNRLPGYMVPSYFFLISRIPLSPNNKLETKELKRIFSDLSHEDLLRFNGVEKTATSRSPSRLIAILAEFMNMDQSRILHSTSIFDLGIDSITAVPLARHLRSRGFSGASAAALIKNPIIADANEALLESSSAAINNTAQQTRQMIQANHHRHLAMACSSLSTTPDKIKYISPCSALQEGIIARALLDPSRELYFNRFQVRFGQSGQYIDVEALYAAWQQLYAAEPILRTVFVNSSQGFQQVALKDLALPWVRIEATNSDHSKSIQDEQYRSWCKENVDSIKSPLRLLYCDADGGSLAIFIFHAIYDGASLENMLNFVAQKVSGLVPEPSVSFLDALATGPLASNHASFSRWVDYLQGFPRVSYNFGSANWHNVLQHTTKVPAEDLEVIRRKYNVTLQSVVLACWSSVLYRRFPASFSSGIVLSGRYDAELDLSRTIGPLFNTLPFFARRNDLTSWSQLIAECHRFGVLALQDAHVPLKDLQKQYNNGDSMFDNLFAFEIEKPKTTVSQLWEEASMASLPDYPIAFEAVKQLNGELRLTVVTNMEGHNVAEASGLLNDFQDAVMAILNDEPLFIPRAVSSSLHELVQSNGSAAEAFDWTRKLQLIRREIAILASISEDDVHPNSQLSELGLDSVDTIQLAGRLRRQGVTLAPTRLMQLQCIANIAPTLESDTVTSPSLSPHKMLHDCISKIEAHLPKASFGRPVESVLPATPLQESMIAGMIDSNFEFYYGQETFELDACVNLDRLQTAWSQLIAESPILRTGFFPVSEPDLDTTYCSVVYSESIGSVNALAITDGLDLHSIRQQIKHQAVKAAGESNLADVTFVVSGESRFMVVSLAHALYDGWSLDLMYTKLSALYHEADFDLNHDAVPLLASLINQDNKAPKQFWQTNLAGLKPSLFPVALDNPQQVPLCRAEGRAPMPLSEILDFCKVHRTTLQTLCQATWALVLGKHVASLDVCFGIVQSGRELDGAANLLYPTMNSLPLRSIIHGTSSSFLSYMNDALQDIRQDQSVSLRQALAAAQISSSAAFNTLFMLQKSATPADAHSLFRSVEGQSAIDYPVCAEAEALDDTLVWRVACQIGPESNQMTSTLLEELSHALQFLIDKPSEPLLTFNDDTVSICGWQGFPLASGQSSEMAAAAIEDSSAFTWNKLSVAIRGALSKVSHVPDVSILPDTSIFELGLDSISAIKVSTLLRHDGIVLTPRDMMKAGSLMDMASAASSNFASDHEMSSISVWNVPTDVQNFLARARLEQSQVEQILPATAAQIYMMSSWSNNEGNIFYPVFEFEVQEVADPSTISAAWRHVVDQTPMLRTMLITTTNPSEPVLQVILRPGSHSDLVKFSVDERLSKISIRLQIHHALYDAVSMDGIIMRLEDTIRGVSFSNHLPVWSTYIQSQVSDQQFWASYLSNAMSSLPETQDQQPSRVSIFTKAAYPNVAPLKALASSNSVTLQSLFFAAYGKHLSALSGSATVIFGIYMANRADTSSDLATYPTLNLVPIKAAIGTEDILSIAKQIQRDLLEISANSRSRVGLHQIYQWTGVRIDSFVNFLSLPEPNEENQSRFIIPKDASDLVPAEPITTAQADLAREWQQTNPVTDAFPVS